MKESINELIEKFNQIKNNNLNESLRNGSTGIGYTFETLIGKKEDQSFNPDFKGIEIKTKLGYSNNPLTLFSLVPSGKENNVIQYLLENFGYYTSKNKEFKTLRTNVFYNKNNIVGNKFIFKLKFNESKTKLKLLILNKNLELLDDNIYWNIGDIYTRLETKLKYLAIVKGYPYKINNTTYYKYTNLNIYKLFQKEKIIQLIKNDKIYIIFNIEKIKNNVNLEVIHDRGTAFKLDLNCIDVIFKKIY